MASIKEKLSLLGRNVREITLKSRDGEQEVKVFYQRPTSIKDRLLREDMKEKYDEAYAEFHKEGPDGKSKYQSLFDEFTKLGSEKTARYIVFKDLGPIRSASVKELGEEEPDDKASKEDKDAYWAKLEPVIEANVNSSIADMATQDVSILAEAAVTKELSDMAQRRAMGTYSMHLIMDSIKQEVEGKKDEYESVFTSVEEIEELLPEETITDLAIMINDEVRKAREIPLKLVGTN
jgi:hypothetical protein